MNRRIKHIGSFVGGLSKQEKPKRPLAFTGGIKAKGKTINKFERELEEEERRDPE
jgi:hypothetical protein